MWKRERLRPGTPPRHHFGFTAFFVLADTHTHAKNNLRRVARVVTRNTRTSKTDSSELSTASQVPYRQKCYFCFCYFPYYVPHSDIPGVWCPVTNSLLIVGLVVCYYAAGLEEGRHDLSETNSSEVWGCNTYTLPP